MNDHYDIYCIQKLGETVTRSIANPYEADEVTCAYVDYLSAEGYGALANDLFSKWVMASAAQLIPTTANIKEREIV